MTTVFHNRFGKGKLVEFTHDNSKVTVDFEEHGQKSLIAKFAGLLKADGSPLVETSNKEEAKLPSAKLEASTKPKKSKGQKKREKDAKEIEKFNSLPEVQKIKQSLLWVNGLIKGDRDSLSYQMWAEKVAEIQYLAKEKENSFIQDVCATVDRYMSISEKQAYCLAKFAADNGMKYE